MSVHKCSFRICIIFYHMRPFNKTTATLVRPHPFSTLCTTPLGKLMLCEAVVALSWSRQMKCTSYLMLCKAIWEVKWSSCKCFNDTNILTVVRTYLCGTLIIIQPCLCQPPHLRLGKLLFCKTFKLQGKDFTHFENNTNRGTK